MDVSQKLNQLLPHWAEHNDAHAKNYSDWAAQAQDAGLTDVALRIREAVSFIEDANGALKSALASLAESN